MHASVILVIFTSVCRRKMSYKTYVICYTYSTLNKVSMFMSRSILRLCLHFQFNFQIPGWFAQYRCYYLFEEMVHRIYPAEVHLNKANSSDTEAPFLDVN